jgi:cytidylate kinase
MERLQKALARAGVASRRACETLIQEGRVTVNGVVVSRLGATVLPNDQLAVDGKPVSRGAPRHYVLLHKPAGVVTTADDPQGRATVLDLVARSWAATVRDHSSLPRLYPVGRLDAETSGVLLLTDDGDLAFQVMHPSHGLEKEYRVVVEGRPSPQALGALRGGIVLDDEATAPATVQVVTTPETVSRSMAGAGAPSTRLRMVISEGRNRQVRRMCLAVGHPVLQLARVRLGNLTVAGLSPGRWRFLTAQEVETLKALAQGGKPTPAVARVRERSGVKPSTITIDGPAAAGKSALGERLADRLQYLYFDTGVLYRAVAWLAVQRGVNAADEAALAQLAAEADIAVSKPTVPDGRQYTVTVGGEDVTWKLRGIDVERIVSPVAAVAGVREALRQRQREIGLAGKIVMVGRDIGTVVLPEADLKIYLTASPEERARRRHREVVARGETTAYEAILASIGERDRIDSQRAVAPLRPADDAVVIDTDGISIDDELSLIERYLG